MQEQIHGNKREKFFVVYNGATNSFTFSNTENKSDYHRLPVVRDIELDLMLYLRRLGATDDELPVSMKGDTYKNMAREILDGSDPYIWIRKGRWCTTVLKITEGDFDKMGKIENFVKKFIESDKDFKSYLRETGEWDDSDEEMIAWKDALIKAMKQLEKLTKGKVKFKSAKGFDRYQGPFAIIRVQSKDYWVWTMDEYSQGYEFYVEDFPVVNTGKNEKDGYKALDIYDLAEVINNLK